MTASPTYQLQSNDADVASRLRAWLDGSELHWPGQFTLDITVAEGHDLPADEREVYWQPSVRIQSGSPHDHVRVEWEEHPAIAIVHATEPRATLWLSPAAAADVEDGARGFLLVVLLFLLRRLGWYHVHAAALTDPRGRGWLIAGNSNCGKSTTTALLATRGWAVGTDDIGFVTQDAAEAESRIAVMSFRSYIALRPGGYALLGAPGGAPLERRNKRGFSVEELGGVWTARVVPSIIAFPRIGERTSMERATPRAALAEIVKWSSWVLYENLRSQENLDVLGKLAAQSQCYHLTLGPDLFENPDLLENLIP